VNDGIEVGNVEFAQTQLIAKAPGNGSRVCILGKPAFDGPVFIAAPRNAANDNATEQV
jgi:hypothetical protein